MPLPDANKTSPRVYTNLQNLDLSTVTFSNIETTGDPIAIEEANEDELRRLVLVNLARLVCAGEWTGLLESGGGAEDLADLSDVLLDATNFVDGLLIQPDSDAAAPTTGTLSSATGNLGIGVEVLKALTSGTYNSILGYQAGTGITSSSYSVALGYRAMQTSTGSTNVAIGGETIKSGDGSNNIAIGNASMSKGVTGQYNVGVGLSALQEILGGEQNVSFGGSANSHGETGSRNVAVGHRALRNHPNGTSSSDNLAIGAGALYEDGEGTDNDGVTGTKNAGVGNFSLPLLVAGNNNLAFGYGAAGNITSGDGNVVIGVEMDPASATGDRQLLIGGNDGSTQTSWIVGDNAGSCYQGDNESAWSTTSDKRLKREITDATKGLDAINAIQVRNFRYRKDNRYGMDPRPSRVGVIAQELEQVFPEAVKENAHGHKTVSTDSINWALLKAVQELSAKVEALESSQ